MNKICKYYQAVIPGPQVILVTSILKSFDHLCFDRSYNQTEDKFEFFVPGSQEKDFLAIMEYFKAMNWVSNLEKKTNRFA